MTDSASASQRSRDDARLNIVEIVKIVEIVDRLCSHLLIGAIPILAIGNSNRLREFQVNGENANFFLHSCVSSNRLTIES